MNGTLQSWFAVSGLWALAGVLWLFMTVISAIAAGKGSGPALSLAMAMAWGAAVVLSGSVVALARVLLWKWMPAGTSRMMLLLYVVAVQCGTLFVQVLSVFVIFNR